MTTNQEVLSVFFIMSFFSTIQEILTFNTLEDAVARILHYYLSYTTACNLFAIFTKQC